MKFLRNPVIATILAAALVVGSTALSVSVKLERACEKAESAFFTVKGSRAPGYYVDQCISDAAALVTVAGHYDSAELGAAARQMKEARSRLVEAYDDEDISDIYEAMQQLYEALDTYASALSAVELTKDDEATCTDMINALDGAYRAVEKSDYNANTQKFIRKTCSGFPAGLFVSVLDIDLPELYAPEQED